jgi:O-acetyl-ADP-ribose deacetylase (regulator of RNase III)
MELIDRVEYRGSIIKCVQGNVLDVKADAIVNPANSLMIMGGWLAGFLKRVGGEIIEREARKYAPVPVGKAVVTEAGRLPYRYVIHAPTMEKPAMRIPPDNAYKAAYASLVKAFDLGVEKLLIPGLGTGVGGLSPLEAGRAVAKAIKDFLDLVPSGIREIIVIDLNKDIPLETCKALRELIGGWGGSL